MPFQYFVYLVDRDSGDGAELGVSSEMSLGDLQHAMLNLFKSDGVRRRIVGVFDEDKRVFFPLSFLLHNMRIFAEREGDAFSIVYEDSTFMNEIIRDAGRGPTERVQNKVVEDEDDEDDDEEEDTHYASETSTEMETIGAPVSPNASLASIPIEFIDAHLKMILDEVASLTLLKKCNLSQMFHALSLHTDSSDQISEVDFLASMEYLELLGTPLTRNSSAIYKRMFRAVTSYDETIYENEDTCCVSIYRICLLMSIFCSGGSSDSIKETSLKIMYNLFDFNRDGFVTLSDAHNCFYMLVKSLLTLFPDVIFDIDEYPLDKVVSALTESLFQGKTIRDGGNTIIQFAYFDQWHRSRDNVVYLLVEAVPNPFMLRGLKSTVISFHEARSELGLEGILPQTLMKCLSHYAAERGAEEPGMPSSSDTSDELDEFQFISRRGVFSAILLASKMESASNVFSADWEGLFSAEVIVCQIFSLYDISQAGYVDKSDIYTGLSVFCGDSFDHRVQTMYPCNDGLEKVVYVAKGCSFFQTLVTRSQMIEYLLAVLKAVLLFGDYDLDDAMMQSLAVRMTNDALTEGALPVTVNGLVSTTDFSSWLEAVISIREDKSTKTNAVPSESESSSSSSSSSSSEDMFSQDGSDDAGISVAEELQAVKKMMGFTGFTAEDVMDLLGEVAREGMISEFNWFQCVSYMCSFNNIESGENRMDEALLFAEKIFNCLAALFPPALSETNERLVNYSLLLSTVTMLCDSPVEDKMFTAFMMLSDTTVGSSPNLSEATDVTTYASMSNVTDYFRGVFAILCAVSPAVQKMTTKMNLTPDDMTMATLQSTMALNNLFDLPKRGFDIDQFTSLAWTCMDM